MIGFSPAMGSFASNICISEKWAESLVPGLTTRSGKKDVIPSVEPKLISSSYLVAQAPAA
ncbi:MAG: hypothetical protein PHS38_09790 [Bacteroidales bacterium]|nr:hypothetical protein [Bacteroidales bacterium]